MLKCSDARLLKCTMLKCTMLNYLHNAQLLAQCCLVCSICMEYYFEFATFGGRLVGGHSLGIWHLAFGIWHLTFDIWHLAFSIWQ